MSEQSNVVLIKLSSGDEIIAKATELDSRYTEIKNPLMVVMKPKGKDEVEVSFVPFMALAEDDVVLILSAHIIAVAQPKDETIKGYLQSIGDVLIQTPPEKKILLS